MKIMGMTRKLVRQNPCPKCGAAPGEACHGLGADKRPRVANHAERRTAAKKTKRLRVASYGRGGSDLWNRVAYALDYDDAAPGIAEMRDWPEIAELESEIERALAVYLSLRFHHNDLRLALGVPEPEEDYYFLIPQYEIGPYRVDFVFGHNAKRARRYCVAVELDGHEWHEKTKAQAARDKARDRYLSQHFGKVIHFTGSEVFDDIRRCADELGQVFAALVGIKP